MRLRVALDGPVGTVWASYFRRELTVFCTWPRLADAANAQVSAIFANQFSAIWADRDLPNFADRISMILVNWYSTSFAGRNATKIVDRTPPVLPARTRTSIVY